MQTIKSPYFSGSDGTQLFYKEWGQGTPAVFLHSWSLTSDMWQYQMLDLANRGVRCIACDMRGHGRSADPGRGYDYDTLADDLAALFDHLDLNNVTLIGHSMAGGVIVRYLTRYGAKRVARIVLVAPVLPFLMKTEDNPDGIDKSVFAQLRGVFAADFPKWLSDNVEAFFAPDTSPAMQRWGMDMSMRSSLKAVIDLNREVTNTDFRAEMRGITVPALIIHGDKDASAPLELTGRKAADLIVGSRLIVYPDGPHGLFVTHRKRLNSDLLEYIRA
jgi:non-heme chloroperoxidase